MQNDEKSDEEFTVTPWEVEGNIDYEKLTEKFGTEQVEDELLEKVEEIAGETHFMLRRGIFYSHRDLDWILEEYEEGNEFALYTGRGPSGHTHVGHLMPWIFAKWVQDKFGVEMFFQLTDDEKFLFEFENTLEKTHSYAIENAKDIIALGFDPEKTHILIDTDNIDTLYPLALKAGKRLNFSNVKAVFGFDNSTNVGSIFYTAIQSAPCFLPTEMRGEDVPVLIPCGIDQDPHFRLTRDIAETLGYFKPALLHNKLAPSLDGSGKMSASQPKTTIFTTDDPEDVDGKINEAFTGGRVSADEQREKGGNPDICAIQNYRYFIFESDDEKVFDIEERCLNGDILCGECKGLLKENIKDFLEQHQRRRKEAEGKLDEFLFDGKDSV